MEQNKDLEQVNKLNSFLVNAFNLILGQEYKILSNYDVVQGISMVEIHVIASVHKLQALNSNTANNIAYDIGVTPGTLTTSVNTLIKKGYLSKEKSNIDKRSIFVKCEEKGEKVAHLHEKLHRGFVSYIIQNYTEDEKKILIDALSKLEHYFKEVKSFD